MELHLITILKLIFAEYKRNKLTVTLRKLTATFETWIERESKVLNSENRFYKGTPIHVCRMSHLRLEAEIFSKRFIVSKSVLDKSQVQFSEGELTDIIIIF